MRQVRDQAPGEWGGRRWRVFIIGHGGINGRRATARYRALWDGMSYVMLLLWTPPPLRIIAHELGCCCSPHTSPSQLRHLLAIVQLSCRPETDENVHKKTTKRAFMKTFPILNNIKNGRDGNYIENRLKQ